MRATLERLVRLALDEDVGTGDATTDWTIPEEAMGVADVLSKGSAVLAGLDAFTLTYEMVDPEVEVEPHEPDGASVEPGDVVLSVSGSARALLTGERVALNFLGRLSGVATATRAYVRAVEGTGARVIDTRKTTPGFRRLEKAAVVAGGGTNHRMGLYDMVLVKDNHIAASGGIEAAVEAVRSRNLRGLPVEVEVTDMEQLEAALRAVVDRVLLDNMTPGQVAQAVARVRASDGPRPQLEASGNMSLDRIRSYADAGVDFISVGAMTHSAPAADFSMRFRS
ncbi:MAG: carboxylating nicotinate-nucleotide diphosphorylase [Gemmatimonadetes bacterium]|nr:carboxylating nicotinate-nucleotide diphosphorylase [Gemmatimonadota bacterium]